MGMNGGVGKRKSGTRVGNRLMVGYNGGMGMVYRYNRHYRFHGNRNHRLGHRNWMGNYSLNGSRVVNNVSGRKLRKLVFSPPRRQMKP